MTTAIQIVLEIFLSGLALVIKTWLDSRKVEKTTVERIEKAHQELERTYGKILADNRGGVGRGKLRQGAY